MKPRYDISFGSTPIGQFDLPGTEPITSAEFAKRRAGDPMKAAVPQKPCDIGLFSDQAAQIDLVDLARKAARG